MFLTSHQFCLRGDDARSIDLPDLYSKTYQHVGPDVPLYVGGVNYSGKTNKNGRLEYFGGIRHMQVEQCAVGAVAMQLFQTFHLLGAGVPDFSSRESWYNLLPLFYENDDVSSNVTAKEAESARLGRWIYDHFRTSYLPVHQLPVGIMLVQAGFKDDRKGYFLPRGRVLPSQDEYPGLANQIFPWADEELRKVKQRNLTGPAGQHDIAAQKFLELLIALRAVLLQDVALLQRMGKYENHPIIYHHFFEGEKWDKFCGAVEEVCNTPAPPPELANIPPEVVAVLQDQQVQLARIERESQASREREQALQSQMSAVLHVLERLVSAFPGEDSQAPTRAPSAKAAAQSPAAPEPRRTATGFFARPPSAPVAAAAEVALRAAAQAARAAATQADIEQATVSDPNESGQASNEGREAAGVDSVARPSSAPVAAAAEAALRAAAEAAKAAAVQAAADAAATQDPDALSGQDENDARAPRTTAQETVQRETGLREGLEPANGSQNVTSFLEGEMETEEATGEGCRQPQSEEEGAKESENRSEGEKKGEVESEAGGESGTTSQPCSEGNNGKDDGEEAGTFRSCPTASQGDVGVSPSGSGSGGLGAADEGTIEDASVVPEWALNYMIGGHYTSVAEIWQEWAYGQKGNFEYELGNEK
ncbi:hypothetical protein KFL_007750010 [Klebsormidium nitens]|uniref:Ndc10 domain-containing protein n=1 Tax=Klebsormidium nitens TaxID=105231 RepID=A0A1Y1IKH2_KLENI|nr:hypothetical protein KFL_007750010 [Klebsormidium nitens]|eukprot:GAQ91375.1 hypothetical protein KFL_007750010 [Klebsormidium nitens]